MTEGSNSDLEWIRFREDTLGREAYPEENYQSKFGRKARENPLVPAGCLLTIGALSYGLWCFRKGKQRQSQMMMRLRVGAQGFTIVAILAGVLWTGTTK